VIALAAVNGRWELMLVATAEGRDWSLPQAPRNLTRHASNQAGELIASVGLRATSCSPLPVSRAIPRGDVQAFVAEDAAPTHPAAGARLDVIGLRLDVLPAGVSDGLIRDAVTAAVLPTLRTTGTSFRS
jgi:hypothetical protein